MRSGLSPVAAPVGMLVVVLLLLTTFGYFYLQSTNVESSQSRTIESQSQIIASQSQTISSQSSKLTTQAHRLADDDSEIANLTTTVQSLRGEVSKLQDEVVVDEANITSLLTEESQANVTIGSLDTQIASLDAHISSLNVQITGLNSNIAADQSQLAALQVEVSQFRTKIDAIITALGEPTGEHLYSNLNFTVAAGSKKVFNFTSASDGGVMLVAIVASTSLNTTVSAMSNDAPVNLGASGIFAYSPAANTSFTIYIYDLNSDSFSAIVNIWYFS